VISLRPAYIYLWFDNYKIVFHIHLISQTETVITKYRLNQRNSIIQNDQLENEKDNIYIKKERKKLYKRKQNEWNRNRTTFNDQC